VAAQLVTLTASAQALCNTMLGIGRGNAHLALRLDEARLQVGPLISEGIHYGVLAALTSVGSHYDGIDFEAVGQGYALKKSDYDILAISKAVVRGVEALACKVSAAAIHAQHQSPDA